jgi:alkylation response protein AidB-like acyl-CoA dehydrogenase
VSNGEKEQFRTYASRFGATPVPWVSTEQAELFDSVYRFATTLPNNVRASDKAEVFAHENWLRCGQFGIQGLPGDPSFGGAGADAVSTMVALEALGYGHADAGLLFAINAHMWTSVVPMSEFGTVEQKERWLPGLCTGMLIGCHAITEPGAGSDVFSLTSTGTPVDGGWLLRGRKTFISNAPVADLFTVFARTYAGTGPYGITAFLVPKGAEGLSVEKSLEKMGLRTSPMAELVVDDCFVPSEAILGLPGRGARVFQAAMRWERACIMASQVGAMRRMMERCVAYARDRQQFGQPIGRFESVADKIANMRISVDASRALILRVGWLMDNGHDTMTEAAIAKAFVSEASVRTHLDAIQVHGGYGYMTELEVERGLRDAVAGTIYSGTSEIQRRIIARAMGL